MLGLMIALIPSLLIAIHSEEPLVNTKYGYVLGSRAYSRNNREFWSFRGIPYAQAPIGNLRFKPPQPPLQWNSPLNATIDGSNCLQFRKLGPIPNQILGLEDCLFLNIYVPKENIINTTDRLPVMVWFHGGGFEIGAGDSKNYGPEFLVDKNVIVVGVNYRLGLLGFLSSLDDNCPGNFGFKDQIMALRFVNENIENFGGDKSRVTIFGESAGSVSVSLHMVSPLAEGLFQAAISQSGVALDNTNTSFRELHSAQFKNLAQAVGCDIRDNNKEIISCLRDIDAVTILQAIPLIANIVYEAKSQLNPEPFLEKSPKDYILEGNFRKVPWIVGVNRDEGIAVSAPLIRQEPLLDSLNSNFKQNLTSLLNLENIIIDQAEITELYDNITNYYLAGNDYLDVNKTERVQGFIDVISDGTIIFQTHKSIELQSTRNDKIWMYNFAYKGNHTYTDLFAGTSHDIDFNWGVAHIDEVPYFFNSTDEVWGVTLTGSDIEVSQDLVELWTNFAIYGEPDPEKIYNWEANTVLNVTGYFGGSPKFVIENEFYKERMEFWSQLPIIQNL